MFQQTRGKMKKFMQKTSVCVLIVTMLLSVIPQTNGNNSQVYAAATVKAVNLEFGGISDPTSTGSTATEWAGSKVYFGNNLWFVLDDSGFLLSEKKTEDKEYNDEETGITWENCSLRKYLNDESKNSSTFLNSKFTAIEQGAIKLTDVTNESNSTYNTSGGEGTEDKIFLLSISEVQNANYGFGSDATRKLDSYDLSES